MTKDFNRLHVIFKDFDRKENPDFQRQENLDFHARSRSLAFLVAWTEAAAKKAREGEEDSSSAPQKALKANEGDEGSSSAPKTKKARFGEGDVAAGPASIEDRLAALDDVLPDTE